MDPSEGSAAGSLSDTQLLRVLVEKTSAMVAYWDATLHCRFANPAYVRWFGVTPAWLIGKHLRELLGPIYEQNLPFIEGALRGEPQQFERTLPDPEGGPPRHSLANYVPDIADGEVRGFFALVTEISEVKRTQLAFKESEERFRLTLDEAPIGMAIVALDGRFVRVNRALCDIVGYAPEELVGLTFQAITHPEDLNKDLALAGQLERGEIPRYQLEKRYIRKDGSVVPVLLSGSVLRTPGGAPIHFIAQVQDIAERKRTEREQAFLARVGPVLDSSLDYAQTLSTVAELAVQDIADLCIIELVEQGEVRRVKVASRDAARQGLCERLMRIPLDRRRPYLMQSVLREKRTLLVQRVTDEMIASSSQSPEHLEVLRAAQIRSLLAVPLLIKGRLLGAIALIASQSAEQYGPADVRLAEELARRAALVIENARLYQMALRATRARDELLGVVAHDLRNPLNNIVLQTTLLALHGPLPEPRCQKAAESIERSAQRMNRLIQDLLDVTRLEAGHLSVEPARVATVPTLLEALETQRDLVARASLSLDTELPDDLPDLWADRVRVAQILENLVGNAVKFTHAGGRITVGARPGDGVVVFWVKDTGCGIDPEHLPRLFERFWQAKKEQGRGAGLGLPIVKGLVEAQGGRIWVETESNVGSTFYFTLPTAPIAST
jgi:PAS domain S-box-containing protein